MQAVTNYRVASQAAELEKQREREKMEDIYLKLETERRIAQYGSFIYDNILDLSPSQVKLLI